MTGSQIPLQCSVLKFISKSHELQSLKRKDVQENANQTLITYSVIYTYRKSLIDPFQSEPEKIFAYSTCNPAKSWTPWSHNKSVIPQPHMWLWALECTDL